MIERLAGAVAMLRPTPAEIVALAKREGDPRRYAAFEPIAAGPAAALAALFAIGIAGAVSAPVRLIRRALRTRR